MGLRSQMAFTYEATPRAAPRPQKKQTTLSHSRIVGILAVQKLICACKTSPIVFYLNFHIEGESVGDPTSNEKKNSSNLKLE